ncbi:hypothetical protein ACH5RR_020566 [Cinchona calisaya]|uniref:Uncharacterized protein n=1 Tax=Cinchona calisaya TaxID=153742 RepID=A0ABD2ZES8_9GENT
MHTAISDVPIKPIKVKSEAKLYSSGGTCRHPSRQTSMSNSSNEVYYGDSSVAIPFRWESQPGTPKVKLSERRPLPPLTPPPSYLCTSPANARAHSVLKKHPAAEAATNNNNGSRILHTLLLPKLNLIKKSNVQSSPSLSSSSSSPSSSSSSPWSSSSSRVSVRSSPFTTPKSAGGQQRKRLSFSSSRKKDKENDDDDDVYESLVSRLCFGIPRNSSNNNISRSHGGSASLFKLLLTESA